MIRLRQIGDGLRACADIVFPDNCAACDATLPSSSTAWCPECTAKLLQLTAASYCARCGRDIATELASAPACPQCSHQPWHVDGVVRLGSYTSALARVIQNYKYNGRQRLDRSLGRWLAQAIAGRQWAAKLDALVPVPINFAERWRYHFYPVGLLASVIAAELSIPLLPALHVRGKRRRQVELSTTQRIENIRGVFHLDPHADVRGATVCVIDDVSTTGATLDEVAKVLKRQGAAVVYAAVLARARSVS